MNIKTATVKKLNNDQMIEDVTQEYGTLAPVESQFQYFTIDDLGSQMLSTGDKLIYQTLEEMSISLYQYQALLHWAMVRRYIRRQIM